MTAPGRSGRHQVDAYIAESPPAMRPLLRALRRTVRAAAPGAEELILYRMPAFRLEGNLVFFAAFRHHLSFFPGSVVTQRRFARELRPFAAGPGTLRFDPDQPLPLTLLGRIVRARVAENRLRARDRLRGAARRSGNP